MVSGAGIGRRLPYACGRPQSDLLRRDPRNRRPRLHRLVGSPAIRQSSSLQTLRQELSRGRWRRQRRNPKGDPRHLRPSRRLQHRTP